MGLFNKIFKSHNNTYYYTFKEDQSLRSKIITMIDQLLIDWHPYFLSSNYQTNILMEDRKQKSLIICDRLKKTRMILDLHKGIFFKNDLRCKKYADEILKNLETISQFYHNGFMEILLNSSEAVLKFALEWQHI